MQIGKVSRQLDIPIETLRYYDRIGLVSPARQGGVRQYSPAEIAKLKAVAKMKTLMFSLTEIQAILSADAQVDSSMAVGPPDREAMKTLRGQILAKYREVEIMATNLREVKAELARLANKIQSFLKEEQSNA